MNRKTFLYILASIPILGLRKASAATARINIFKDPTCSCCGKWAEHLRANGFEVSIQEVKNLGEYRKKYGVPEGLASCHTATIEGYTVEGHVPAREILRLLKERPNAKGLAVPGMPVGSPGMESTRTQTYSVMLFDATGRSTVFQSYPVQ